uniref:Uncharacterized protein n=1 Tax=Chenopodium quinoa TaxID=63459 RepID=A0A803NA46_CHEQI
MATWNNFNSQASISRGMAKSVMDVESFTSWPGSTEKSSEKDRGNPNVTNDPRVRLNRDCVGTMAAYRLKNLSQLLLTIVNTQLYWDPKWPDDKSWLKLNIYCCF